ncbi:DUF3325 family protein [Lysobacter maris]|uniref:DUF3325 family protein n=1 Tax=Marilutibacter maris TaxID=1605891 RepID=A0A508B2A6_9GAMM|nr:DUF3325 domain-containing protein [Lysobacter maris]KAB8198130.1 DUF3325 family protein [Lysobacter maris]
MFGVVLALSIGAWMLLALGLPRHRQAVFGAAASDRGGHLLRLAGWSLLPLAFAIAVEDHGWGQGPIFWAAALVIAALAWVLLMALWPRRSWCLATALALLSAGAGLA